jgi:hypothetical protein
LFCYIFVGLSKRSFRQQGDMNDDSDGKEQLPNGLASHPTHVSQ